MSQEAIQAKKSKTSTKKKALTFEQINPKWCHIIHREPATKQVIFNQNHTIIDLTNPKYCVVGEAHGNNGDYFDYTKDDFCQNCFNHAIRFPYLMEEPPSERRSEVERFVDHWNSEHV
ncbi:MAG: hypothetical protein V3V41_02085 [Candidatus Heimdallarchaeota archaeon]